MCITLLMGLPQSSGRLGWPGGRGGTEASSMLKVQEDRPGRRQHAVTGPGIGVRRVFLPTQGNLECLVNLLMKVEAEVA